MDYQQYFDRTLLCCPKSYSAESALGRYWDRKKHDGLSRLLNLSVGGVCLSTDKSEGIFVGEKIHLNFLTPEGKSEPLVFCGTYVPSAWDEIRRN